MGSIPAASIELQQNGTMALTIDVAIPTFNRAAELARTLTGLSKLDTPPGVDWGVIVVDNNSSDGTQAAIDLLAPQFGGRLKGVVEHAPGLCHARNAAVRASRADIIAFLDDDVDVEPAWLAAHCRAFAEENCAVVGGRAELLYPCNKPTWIRQEEEAFLSRVNLGAVRRKCSHHQLGGLNLAVRREWFAKVGLFRSDLDRVGLCLLSCGETELLERIARAGGTLIYEPDAIVWHRVPNERLQKEWFLNRSYWQVRSELRMSSVSKDTLSELAGCAFKAGCRGAGLMWRILSNGADSDAAYLRRRWYVKQLAELAERSRAFGLTIGLRGM
jgi:glycosyltransferase involved in cell wall biosynthesis